jgi:putative transposase
VGMSPPRHPRRPPRLEWLFSNREPLYFVTFNTFKRRRMLARPEVHDVFRNFCLRGKDRGIPVGRYVLMPDHVHLFVFITEQDTSLERWVQALRSVVGKQLLKLRIEKPHWQEGFFDHLLRSSESYSKKWDYVRMNPVRAGFCKNPEDWPYQGEIVHLPFE